MERTGCCCHVEKVTFKQRLSRDRGTLKIWEQSVPKGIGDQFLWAEALMCRCLVPDWSDEAHEQVVGCSSSQ